MRERTAIAVGAAAHVALLAAPTIALGRAGALAGDAAAASFLLLATTLCAGEAGWSDGESGGAGFLPASAGALALLLCFEVSLAEHLALGRPRFDGTVVVGAMAMAFGVALRLAAVRALGRWFVSEPRVVPGQPLVRTGAFRLLRHPSESGLLLLSLGACVLLGSVAGLAVWAFAVVPLALKRVAAEEALLARAFGAAWRAYADSTDRLAPGL